MNYIDSYIYKLGQILHLSEGKCKKKVANNEWFKVCKGIITLGFLFITMGVGGTTQVQKFLPIIVQNFFVLSGIYVDGEINHTLICFYLLAFFFIFITFILMCLNKKKNSSNLIAIILTYLIMLRRKPLYIMVFIIVGFLIRLSLKGGFIYLFSLENNWILVLVVMPIMLWLPSNYILDICIQLLDIKYYKTRKSLNLRLNSDNLVTKITFENFFIYYSFYTISIICKLIGYYFFLCIFIYLAVVFIIIIISDDFLSLPPSNKRFITIHSAPSKLALGAVSIGKIVSEDNNNITDVLSGVPNGSIFIEEGYSSEAQDIKGVDRNNNTISMPIIHREYERSSDHHYTTVLFTKANIKTKLENNNFTTRELELINKSKILTILKSQSILKTPRNTEVFQRNTTLSKITEVDQSFVLYSNTGYVKVITTYSVTGRPLIMAYAFLDVRMSAKINYTNMALLQNDYVSDSLEEGNLLDFHTNGHKTFREIENFKLIVFTQTNRISPDKNIYSFMRPSFVYEDKMVPTMYNHRIQYKTEDSFVYDPLNHERSYLYCPVIVNLINEAIELRQDTPEAMFRPLCHSILGYYRPLSKGFIISSEMRGEANKSAVDFRTEQYQNIRDKDSKILVEFFELKKFISLEKARVQDHSYMRDFDKKEYIALNQASMWGIRCAGTIFEFNFLINKDICPEDPYVYYSICDDRGNTRFDARLESDSHVINDVFGHIHSNPVPVAMFDREIYPFPHTMWPLKDF